MDGAAADATGNANVDKGTGAGFEHICKILRRRDETSIPIDVRFADEISRRRHIASTSHWIGTAQKALTIGSAITVGR